MGKQRSTQTADASRLVLAQRVKRVERWLVRLFVFALSPLYVLTVFVRLPTDAISWVSCVVGLVLLALSFVDHDPRIE